MRVGSEQVLDPRVGLINVKVIKTLFSIALLFFLATILQGQSAIHRLSIKVVSKKGAQALENATVALKPCECGGFTDEEGRFNIQLPENLYKLTISYVGFLTYSDSVDLREDRYLEISLEEEVGNLSGVVVTSDRTVDRLTGPVTGLLNLEAEELKTIPAAMGEFDVLRGITLLPGINSAGEVSNGISVRGSSLDQNLILFDGAPVFNPTHLFGLFSVFTPEVISSVDLYKANVPANYGGRVSSVTDIRVKSPLVDNTRLSGGVGLVSSRFSIQTPIVKDRLNLLAGARVGFTGLLLPHLSDRLKKTKTNFADATLKLLYMPGNKDQLSLTTFFSTDFYQLDLISRIENITSTSNQYDFSTFNSTIKWVRSIDRRTSLRSTLVNSNYRPKLLFPIADSDNKIVFDSRVRQLSLTSEVSQNLSSTFEYSAGLQWLRYKIDPGELDPGNETNISGVSLNSETSYELSPFIEAGWQPSGKLRLSAGLRYTRYWLNGPYTLASYDELGSIISTVQIDRNKLVQSYDGLEPRFGLSFRMTNSMSVKASYSRMFQYLQNIYNSTSPIPTSRWKTADPFIEPQSADSYSLGFYKTLHEEAIEVSIEGYLKKLDKVLTYKPGSDFFLERFIEREVVQGRGKTYGVEFGLKKPKGKTTGWVNYTWSRSFVRSQNERLADRINNNNWFPSDFDRPHVFNATIHFQGELYNDVGLSFTLQSGRPYSVANGAFRQDDVLIPVFLERNNSRLRTYHRLDFSWKIKSTLNEERRYRSDWTLTIYNVYARKNAFNQYYSQTPATHSQYRNGPFSAYEVVIFNAPVLALTYNFTFE